MCSAALDLDVCFLGGRKISCLLFQSEGLTNEGLVLLAYETSRSFQSFNLTLVFVVGYLRTSFVAFVRCLNLVS